MNILRNSFQYNDNITSTYPLTELLDNENTSDSYNNFLDSFNEGGEKRFFEEFQEKYDQFKIVKNIRFNAINFFSFLNFVRYQQYIKPYLRKLKFNPNWNKGILSVTFEINNSTSAKFQLIFQQNGIVRFLSLDKDHDDEETLSYVIDGTFSSSSLIRKSYKIKRLMGILTEVLNEECEEEHISDNDMQELHNVMGDEEYVVTEYILP